ncbi:MAG: glycoside hydrolase family 57 protein [Sulfolobaceae archaeon]|nr:glycoside hydrolase family 57 protein [Sulfolobaceae archaeon]
MNRRLSVLLIMILALPAFLGGLTLLTLTQSSSINVNFQVYGNGTVTVFLSGLPQSNTITLHYGIEDQPQGSWIEIFNAQMTWNGHNFSATIGPFNNNTWIAWVFYDNTTGQWINYDNHPFWNWNLLVNPSNVGQTYATVLPNGSILITAIGRAPDEFYIHYGLTTGPQTGLPWSNITDEQMTYNPLWGNYTVIIGPFSPGQWVQWVYHDITLNKWYSNNGQNFAIQDVYSFLQFVYGNYSRYVFTDTQQGEAFAIIDNTYTTTYVNITLLYAGEVSTLHNILLNKGNNTVAIPINLNGIAQGIYYPTLEVYQGSNLLLKQQMPELIVLNTTGKEPLSVVIVWNMHQPLYVAPNGSWEQPWVWLHTGQDFYWNGSLVGAYELQAMLINQFNVSVTIDFTPVLLYQWETILHEPQAIFTSNFGVNVTHDIQSVNYTLNLYKKLVEEGKVEVLTVPFYHPLQPILLDNGWYSDVLTQIEMGKEMTEQVFCVYPIGTWTPEMAFSMGLVALYNETNISFTVLDQQAFLPYVTLVQGNTNPDQVFIVENSLGQRIYVLFRNSTLSNEFGFKFFSQPPQLTAQELIQQLAIIYMNNPGGVVTIALDGENPLIFNPTTGPEDLYAIYQALSEYQGQWLITQTAYEAIKTHNASSIITNLPESSWDLNLDYWNNGYPGKIYIWQNLSVAREYLVAFTHALGYPLSPVVPLLFNETPNSTNLYYTLWNYLYVAEGSDWTWQTGPPAYGPQWFFDQAMLYTHTIVNIVKEEFQKINISGTVVGGHIVVVKVNNGIGEPLRLLMVISNGTVNITKDVILDPGLNVIPIITLNLTFNNNATVYLYSHITQAQVGASIIPINQYGFLVTKAQISPFSFQMAGVNVETKPLVAMSPTLSIILMAVIIGAILISAFMIRRLT